MSFGFVKLVRLDSLRASSSASPAIQTMKNLFANTPSYNKTPNPISSALFGPSSDESMVKNNKKMINLF